MTWLQVCLDFSVCETMTFVGSREIVGVRSLAEASGTTPSATPAPLAQE